MYGVDDRPHGDAPQRTKRLKNLAIIYISLENEQKTSEKVTICRI